MTENLETIFDLFSASATKYSARPFLHTPEEAASIYGLSQRDYLYSDAQQLVDELMLTYRTIGVREGVRVGLAFENRPMFFLHFLAVNALGGSILPLNCGMQPDELRYQVDHSECALIVAVEEYEGLFRNIAGKIDRIIVVCSPESLSGAHFEKATIPQSGFDDARHREAAILYTSGTTGKPKGCILSNEYFLAIGDLYTGLGGCCVFEPGRERIITPLPVTHMNALACSFMAAMQTGACLIQLDRFHPRSWWKTARESKATIMHYLGVMPAMLLRAGEAPDDDFSGQIKFAFGAGCDPRHHERFENRFGVPLIEAWAMTETGAGAWITAAQEPRHVGARCFGRAPDGLEYKLVDEQGGEVSGETPGELLVRRSGDDPRRYFFSAYLKDEKSTGEAWAGGWFHTGDVVRVDADEYFYFVDRRKNVVRRSGENIAAIDVESVLMRHAGVANCVVVPVPDEIRGDEVAALIIPAKTQSKETLAREIFDFAMENLIYFKAPGYICFIDQIPMTASEKVKRGDAKVIVRELVENGACFDFNASKKQRRS